MSKFSSEFIMRTVRLSGIYTLALLISKESTEVFIFRIGKPEHVSAIIRFPKNSINDCFVSAMVSLSLPTKTKVDLFIVYMYS